MCYSVSPTKIALKFNDLIYVPHLLWLMRLGTFAQYSTVHQEKAS